MAIDIRDFTLFSAALELRYPPRFLIWDKIGTFWTELIEYHPELRVKKADAKETAVQLDRTTNGVVQIEKAWLVNHLPSNDLKELKGYAKVFVPNLTTILGTQLFTRIGMRLIFSKSFDSRENAAQFLARSLKLPNPQERHLGIEGKLLDPELAFRWEGDKTGYLLRFQSVEQKLEVDLPFEFRDAQPETWKEKRCYVRVDIDYYVHAETRADKVNSEDLIDSWLKIIRREIGSIASVG
jgi:hypothetical protein